MKNVAIVVTAEIVVIVVVTVETAVVVETVAIVVIVATVPTVVIVETVMTAGPVLPSQNRTKVLNWAPFSTNNNRVNSLHRKAPGV